MKTILFILALLFAGSIYGQSPLTNREQEDFDENVIDPDSVDYEAYTKKTSSFKALFNGTPGKAIMYGMLIPGGGQMYNRKYWKAPIAWALEGAGIYTFIFIRNRYNKFDEAYRQAVMEVEGSQYLGITGVEPLDSFRKQYQKRSEQAGVAMIVIHIVIAIEAYIDKHLSIFDIDEDLSIRYAVPGITKGGKLAGVGVKYSF